MTDLAPSAPEAAPHDEVVMAALAALSDPDSVTVRLKVAFVHAMGGTETFDLHDVALLLERSGLPLSSRKAARALVASGLATEVEPGTYRTTTVLDATSFDAASAAELWSVPLAAVRDLVTESSGRERSGAFDLDEVTACIGRTQRWALEIIHSSRQLGADGVTVFWDCEDTAHRPFSTDVGSMATIDVLQLWGESARYGLSPAPLSDLEADDMRWAWELALGLVSRRDEWTRGSLALPAWDDDFVGTFDLGNAALGPCPTLDATANQVLAHLTLLSAGLDRRVDPDGEHGLRPRALAAIVDAAECVLRWQDPCGGWAIHRYDVDRPTSWALPVRDLSTRYAVDALLAVARCADLPDDLRARSREATARAGELLLARAQTADGLTWWGRDLAHEDPRLLDAGPAAGVARATAMVATVLPGVVAPGADLDRILAGAHRFLIEWWRPDPEGVALVEFRVPTWSGPGDVFPWELPIDPILVTALIRDAAPGATRAPVAEAIGHGLDSEVHGHWYDIPMFKEGKVRAFVGNSLHYHRAMLDYLAWQAVALPSTLAPVSVRSRPSDEP